MGNRYGFQKKLLLCYYHLLKSAVLLKPGAVGRSGLWAPEPAQSARGQESRRFGHVTAVCLTNVVVQFDSSLSKV